MDTTSSRPGKASRKERTQPRKSHWRNRRASKAGRWKKGPSKKQVPSPKPEMTRAQELALYKLLKLHFRGLDTQYVSPDVPDPGDPNWVFYNATEDSPKTSAEVELSQAFSASSDVLQNMLRTFSVIFDTGATWSVTPDPSDCDGPIESVDPDYQLKGLAKGLKVTGKSQSSRWCFLDKNGRPCQMKNLPMLVVPDCPQRLLSTTSLLMSTRDPSGRDSESLSGTSRELRFSGTSSGVPAFSVKVNPANNLPTGIGFNTDCVDEICAHLGECVTSANNLNLSAAEKCLQEAHFCLGHLHYRQCQELLWTGALLQSEYS